MRKVDVLIVGAGLAGLSAAYHLNRESVVVEAEAEPGGKSRSIQLGNCTFDFTGHLLHMRTPEIQNLVNELLPESFDTITRKAGIFIYDRFLPFPFQANFHALPQNAVKECLLGFVKAWKEYDKNEKHTNLASWADATFGDGICKHFFYPYNEKLYRTPLEKMTADWVSWSVPQPTLETVIDGALGMVQEGMGYNATFMYPKEGGIGTLPKALASKVDEIHYQQKIIAIDIENKTAESASGEKFTYDTMISTAPLTELLAMIKPASDQLDAWSRGLRYVNVYNVNLVLDKEPEWDWQWLYLPEPEYACYRIGVSSNITSAVAPKGLCTVYCEFSYLPGEDLKTTNPRENILKDLRAVGLLYEGVNILDELIIDIQHAYVVHDHFRERELLKIHNWLNNKNIFSTGRWGEWVYGGMEDALIQGMKAATTING